jgi:GT2 family glycosyltransferase
VAFFDDDTTAEPNWFNNLSRTWAENPDAGCVTGLVLPMSLESEAQVAFERDGGFRRAFLPDRHGNSRWKDPLHPCGPGRFGAGANMSLNRKLILDLGGFDEALDTGRPLPGGGDLDIFYRVIRGSSRLIYDPSIVVRHDHRRDIRALRHQYYTWGLGFFAFLQKSKKSDPKNIRNLSQMGRWFWLEMGRRLIRSLFGLENRSTRMFAAEFYGGIKGRFGEYERSQKRSRKIREAAK